AALVAVRSLDCAKARLELSWARQFGVPRRAPPRVVAWCRRFDPPAVSRDDCDDVARCITVIAEILTSGMCKDAPGRRRCCLLGTEASSTEVVFGSVPPQEFKFYAREHARQLRWIPPARDPDSGHGVIASGADPGVRHAGREFPGVPRQTRSGIGE